MVNGAGAEVKREVDCEEDQRDEGEEDEAEFASSGWRGSGLKNRYGHETQAGGDGLGS